MSVASVMMLGAATGTVVISSVVETRGVCLDCRGNRWPSPV